MSGFFDLFPHILYTFDDPALGNFKQAVNIFVRTKMLGSVLSGTSIYYSYYIKDGDTPEIIAAKYYNDPTTHWIILYANQIIDPYYEWPLTTLELQNNMVSQFGSVANAQSTLHHIEKRTNVTLTANYTINTNTYVSVVGTNVTRVDGSSVLPNIAHPIIQVGANNVVSFVDGSLVDTSVQLVAISNYDNTFNVNESNRNIKLIKKDFVSQIQAELQGLM